MAANALESRAEYEKRRKESPENSGKPWTGEEDKRVINEFENGKSIKDISKGHGRSVGSIHSRLVRLGKISLDDIRFK